MNSVKLSLYRLLVTWLPETSCFWLKAALLRWCGARVGRNVRICSSAMIVGVGNLEIGDDVWIGSRCFLSLSAPAGVIIGSHVDIGPEVMFLTGSHEIDPTGDHIGGKGTAAPVSIGSGSWLGARTTILPGVMLASKTITAAGSVVTKSCETPKVLLAGLPAQAKKGLDDAK